MRGLDYVAKRTAFALGTVLVAITLNFVLFRAVPGDAVQALGCLQCTPEFRAYLRATLGLDESLPEQFWIYLSGIAQGDLGTSLRTQAAVTSELWVPLRNTVAMVALGVVFALVLGTLIGVVSAWRRNTVVGRAGTWTALVFNSLPPQWLGLLVVLYVADAVGLPSSGIKDPLIGVVYEASTWQLLLDRVQHMLLPALTLGLVLMGNYTLTMRSAMLETLGQDYLLTARAKGMSSWAMVWRHAFVNARLPLVTYAALSSGFIAGGAITIELVFSYPGVGLRILEAIEQRDWPVLQGIFLVITVSVIVANLVADLLYYKLDPRVTT